MSVGAVGSNNRYYNAYYSTRMKASTNNQNSPQGSTVNAAEDPVHEVNLPKELRVQELEGAIIKDEHNPLSKDDSKVDPLTGEEECQTCKNRKYQDGSDDSGVSYQTPTHISTSAAPAAVKAHENEHVVRERAAAEREGREVVSQSVVIKTSICPECGKTYVSGGETITTTRAKVEKAYASGLETKKESFNMNI